MPLSGFHDIRIPCLSGLPISLSGFHDIIRYFAISIFCFSIFCNFDIFPFRYFAFNILSLRYFAIQYFAIRYFVIRYFAFRYFVRNPLSDPPLTGTETRCYVSMAKFHEHTVIYTFTVLPSSKEFSFAPLEKLGKFGT